MPKSARDTPVKMLVQTFYDRKARFPGDRLKVPADVAERWATNGIAELGGGEPPDEMIADVPAQSSKMPGLESLKMK